LIRIYFSNSADILFDFLGIVEKDVHCAEHRNIRYLLQSSALKLVINREHKLHLSQTENSSS